MVSITKVGDSNFFDITIHMSPGSQEPSIPNSPQSQPPSTPHLPSPGSGTTAHPNDPLPDGPELATASREQLLIMIQDLQSRLQCAEDNYNSTKQWLRDTLGLVAQQQLLILRTASQPNAGGEGQADMQSDLKTRFDSLQTSKQAPPPPPRLRTPPRAPKRPSEGPAEDRGRKKRRSNSPSANIPTQGPVKRVIGAGNGTPPHQRNLDKLNDNGVKRKSKRKGPNH